jgi:hypothetical protein
MKTWTLSSLESEFKIALPPEYRRFMESYPTELAGALYSNNPKMGGPCNFELQIDLQRVVDLNHEIRDLWPESDYADTPFPESYFLIGDDGGGNVFAIDTAKSADCVVFEFDHEVGNWNTRANSIQEFAEQLLGYAKQLRELSEERGKRKKRKGNR